MAVIITNPPWWRPAMHALIGLFHDAHNHNLITYFQYVTFID
jgi:hypothetical protein